MLTPVTLKSGILPERTEIEVALGRAPERSSNVDDAAGAPAGIPNAQ